MPNLKLSIFDNLLNYCVYIWLLIFNETIFAEIKSDTYISHIL